MTAAGTTIPTSSVLEVMRELAHLVVDQAATRPAAERIVAAVDRQACRDAIAADTFQRALERLVDAADHTADNGGPGFDQALDQAREVCGHDPAQERSRT